tara:strand:+ start:107 stop:1312 length:1206 start_codon:yes stop_codon:yes gene_type:complete
MKYGSVCSGVEAATAAWHPLGWEPQWFSEIEKFPSAVLDHHYPDVPNYGDMTKFKEWNADTIDLLVGGTPCQSFSIAGLRKGLEDPRGNLMLTYLAMAEQLKPKWLVWENVPGVLSSNGGRDFGTFLAALGQIGYGFSWRVLDAQYFGLAQRRKRVFVVGYLGDWRRAAAVLFEPESLSGHPAPSREAREEVAGYTATSFGKYSEGVGTVRAAGGDLGGGSETLHVEKWPAQVASTLNAAFGSKQGLEDQHINGGAPLFVPTLPIAFGAQNSASQGDSVSTEVTPTLDKSKTPAVAWSIMPMNSGKDYKARITDVSQPLMAGGPVGGNQGGDFIQHSAVRRLTPTECERLQGFPDGYTQIPWRNKAPENCPDGPRYKAMGNSMAVPVMRWIGERIQKTYST